MTKIIKIFIIFPYYNQGKSPKWKKKRVPIVVLVFVFVGCLLIGAGIGNAFDAMDVGGPIGIGAGFIGMDVIWTYFRNK